MSLPLGHYHLVGIAGVGMSALAQALLNAGARVSGSDRFFDQGRGDLDVLQTLARAGVRLTPQDGSGLSADLAGVVVSTAVEADNPDLQAAQRLGVPVLHRAEMLAKLAAGQRVLAVAGTAGKTTVTGLLGHLLTELGADPTVVNGGNVINWQRPEATGSVRRGGSPLWVLEVDESDRSLLRFAPDWAIVTNISKDHFELDEVIALFRQFAGQVRTGILCGPGVADQLRPAGLTAALHEPPGAVFQDTRGWGFQLDGVEFPSPLPGRHNAENALLAAALCLRLGYAPEQLRQPLAHFQGIQRRLECVGVLRGARIYDDYAHNPAKIAAAWRAVAPPQGRVFGIWRPHGYGPLALMFQDLAATFAAVGRPGDRIFILPVFYAGGTAKPTASAEQLVAEQRKRGLAAEAVPDYAALEARLRTEVGPGDAVLCMGARDPDLPRFARRLAAEPA